MLSMIAVVAKNSALGKDGQLLCHLPEDLKRFRRITTGHSMIMGRKTLESFGRPLPKRQHLVVTRNLGYNYEHEQVTIFHSLDDLLASLHPKREYFVVGGGEIYRQLLPLSDKLYLTIIDHEFVADTFFPQLDMAEWEIIEDVAELGDHKSPYSYKYVTLQRRK